MIALETYATAYFRTQSDPLDGYSKINQFKALLDQDNAVWTAINGNSKSYELIKDIVGNSFGLEFANLVGVFVQDARLDEWDRLVVLYRDILVEQSYIYDVKVCSAKSLTSEEKIEVETKINSKYHSQCEFRFEVDESLIKGMKIVINHQTIDVSIRGVLDKIKKEVLK